VVPGGGGRRGWGGEGWVRVVWGPSTDHAFSCSPPGFQVNLSSDVQLGRDRVYNKKKTSGMAGGKFGFKGDRSSGVGCDQRRPLERERGRHDIVERKAVGGKVRSLSKGIIHHGVADRKGGVLRTNAREGGEVARRESRNQEGGAQAKKEKGNTKKAYSTS